jgi:NADPH-dependent curcumin reductase CurA
MREETRKLRWGETSIVSSASGAQAAAVQLAALAAARKCAEA